MKLKIAKYLRRAEEIFNCHLQRTLGSGASPDTVRRPSLGPSGRGGLWERQPRPTSIPLPIQGRVGSGGCESKCEPGVPSHPSSLSHTLTPHSASRSTWHA